MFQQRIATTRIQKNLSLYLLYYAEVCNELEGLSSASLHPSNTAPSEEMSQRRWVVDSIVSNLTGLTFQHQTSCSREQRVIIPSNSNESKNIALMTKYYVEHIRSQSFCEQIFLGLCTKHPAVQNISQATLQVSNQNFKGRKYC